MKKAAVFFALVLICVGTAGAISIIKEASNNRSFEITEDGQALITAKSKWDSSVELQVYNEQYPRLILRPGRLVFGPGTTYLDTALFRQGSRTLQTNAKLVIMKKPDNKDAYFVARKAGEPEARFVINQYGGLSWGPGNAPRDVALYRPWANALQTNANLRIGKNVVIEGLKGNYTNGEAYVCVNNNGRIFASEDPCA